MPRALSWDHSMFENRVCFHMCILVFNQLKLRKDNHRNHDKYVSTDTFDVYAYVFAMFAASPSPTMGAAASRPPTFVEVAAKWLPPLLEMLRRQT